MRHFKQKNSALALIWRAIFYPIPVPGTDFEFGLGSLIALVLLVPILGFSLLIGLANKQSVFTCSPPLICVIPLIVILFAGLISGKSTLLRIREYFGMEPQAIYLSHCDYEEKDKERGRLRYMGYVLLAFSVSSFITWLIWIFPLDYYQLDVRGDTDPITSFLDTWVRSILPIYINDWFYIFVRTLVIVVAMDLLPFTRMFFRRTRIPELVGIAVFIVLLVMMAYWWYKIWNQPSF